MRRLLLYFSRLRWLRRVFETSSLARRFASRFVAGDSLEEALIVCRELHDAGMATTLDHLGESVSSAAEAAAARDAYLVMLPALAATGIDGNVSLKLSQFGMDLDGDLCRANLEALVARAAASGQFVRVDMESSAYTDQTLELVRDLHARYHCVGTVIQAYLYRSRKDVELLNQLGIRVRLCKGAYLEPPEVAISRKPDVDRNYLELMQLLLDHGTYPAIATHDARIIAATREFVETRGIGRDTFEFQMLYGIRRDLQRELTRAGYKVRVYVPFGRAWYPYFMRRLAERPANLLFLVRNLFRH